MNTEAPKRTPANRAADRTYNAKRVVVAVSFNPDKESDRLAKLATIPSVTAWVKTMLDAMPSPDQPPQHR